MATCPKKCRATRISSRAVQNMPNGCFDVCTTPICGDPNVLSLMSPLIYDEIGINLCTTFDIGTTISTTYPTATNATVQVVDIAYTYGAENVQINAIPSRPNCYDISLSNLTATFALNVYDANCNLLGTEYPTAVYLPPQTTAPTYDADTNPTSVDLELFAPYGASQNEGDPMTPALNYIGFTPENNYVRQGINLYAVPKLLDFDAAASTATVGLTLILQSLYFAGYNVASAGKIPTPKGEIIPSEDSLCLSFVAGDLLDLAIKPLDLTPPACEGEFKNDCSVPCGSCMGNASLPRSTSEETEVK